MHDTFSSNVQRPFRNLTLWTAGVSIHGDLQVSKCSLRKIQPLSLLVHSTLIKILYSLGPRNFASHLMASEMHLQLDGSARGSSSQGHEWPLSHRWLWKQLKSVITSEFLFIAQHLGQSPSTEAEFLELIHRKLYNLRLAARAVDRCFRYFNRFFNDYEVYDKELPWKARPSNVVYALHMWKIQEVLVPKVRTTVQANGIKHIINGGSLNTLSASAFASIDGRSAYREFPQIRAVYLVSEKLAIFNYLGTLATSDKKSSPDSQILPGHGLSKSPFRMATMEHWALIVDCPVVISTHNLTTSGTSSEISPAASTPQTEMLRCELVKQREHNARMLRSSCRTVTGGFDCRTLIPIGYTYLSNGTIRRKGRRISYIYIPNFRISPGERNITNSLPMNSIWISYESSQNDARRLSRLTQQLSSLLSKALRAD